MKLLIKQMCMQQNDLYMFFSLNNEKKNIWNIKIYSILPSTTSSQ